MGFDITMHPFSTKEFKYYFEEVLTDNTSDLVIPFTGDSNTYPPNLRAKHLENIENHENKGKSKKLEILSSAESKPKKGFWNRFKRDK